MRIARWIVLIPIGLCGFLSIWTFLPAEEINLSAPLEYPVYDSRIFECDLLDLLSENRITIIHPAFIDEDSFGKIIINIQSDENGDKEFKREAHDCSLIVITSINLTNANLFPGRSIIYPYNGQDSLLINFDVFPAKVTKFMEGNAYISVDMKGSETYDQTHLLIFVVPVKIKVRKLFGFPPKTARIISLVGLAFFGIIYLAIPFFER